MKELTKTNIQPQKSPRCQHSILKFVYVVEYIFTLFQVFTESDLIRNIRQFFTECLPTKLPSKPSLTEIDKINAYENHYINVIQRNFLR